MYEILREKNTVSVLKILLGDPEEWQFRFRTLRLKAFKVQEWMKVETCRFLKKLSSCEN